MRPLTFPFPSPVRHRTNGTNGTGLELSCQLSSINPEAFENLKMVVELDFSWNRLARVPIAQIRHLSLLRRLSLRGNPLGRLDELTMGPPRPLAEASAAGGGTRPELGLARNMSRLAETYPQLVRSVLRRIEWSKSRVAAVSESQEEAERTSSNDGPLMGPTEGEMLESLKRIFGRQEAGGSSVGGGGELAGNDLLAGSIDTLDQLDEALDKSRQTDLISFGRHFGHLQELDLGECKLSYISWTTLTHLSSLKRLLLDGNQLRWVGRPSLATASGASSTPTTEPNHPPASSQPHPPPP